MHSISGFENFPHAREVLEAGLTEGVYPGCVAGVWSFRDPDLFHFGWGGHRRLRSKGLKALPMERDTVFDLASISKVMGTASLAMAMIERGWITWDTPLRAILSDFRHFGITLRELAGHTSGLPAWSPFFEKMREIFQTSELERISIEERQALMRRLVMDVDLDRAPKTKAVYSDIGFLLLGFALEEVSALSLDKAVSRFVWNPMELEGAYYSRTIEAAFRSRDERVAATEDCPWRRSILQGQVHDDNAWAMGGFGGHAGVFSNARTVLQFGKRMLEGAFSRRVTQEAWTRLAVPEGCDRTPGWDTPSGDSPALGKKFSARSVGHLGFTGTSLWIDPDSKLVVTLLTNRVHPHRENTLIRSFRIRFHDALGRDFFRL